MKKIPTIFVRDLTSQPAVVTQEWNSECHWVRDGAGIATRKFDGTCVLIRNDQLYKRRELKPDQIAPPDFELIHYDSLTRKTVGWMPVTNLPEDQWHVEAYRGQPDGTYELVGPNINGNKDRFEHHTLVPHGQAQLLSAPRSFTLLREWLADTNVLIQPIEGLVWHHPDGRMAKIKRRDFGLKW